MSSLYSKFRGKLPPGAAAQLQQVIRDARKLAKTGELAGIEILGCDECPVSKAQAGKIYSVDLVPSLPLPGCERSPCCGCCYVVIPV